MSTSLSVGRIYWLDYAKMVGVFLMIYGHGSLCGDLRNYVFSFHTKIKCAVCNLTA